MKLNRKLLLGSGLAAVVVAAAIAMVAPGVRTPPASSVTEPIQVSASTTTLSRPLPVSAAEPNERNALSAARLLEATKLPPNHPETRLIAIYAQIEKGELPVALENARKLVEDFPHFQLAQLVYGDLLKLRFQPTADVGAPDSAQIAALRAESRKRIDALRHRPEPGSVPAQFVSLSPTTRHAIAVDATRSRLYLFENEAASNRELDAVAPPKLRLVADYFISVGKSGIGKQVEGDGRTPLGGYYITSMRDKKGLPPLYGVGALPINYPNAFDAFKGRTGSGIWLHGTPPEQFARAPLASDGCVVLSNPDMQQLLNSVAPRTTPVVIAEQLQWVQPDAQQASAAALRKELVNWMEARKTLSTAELTQQFGATAARTGQTLQRPAYDLTLPATAQLSVVNLSLLHTTQPEEGMVATFEEAVDGKATGLVRRQYWLRSEGQWKLLQDTVLAGTPNGAAPLASRTSSGKTTEQQAPVKDLATASNRPVNGADEEAVRQAIQTWTRAWSQKNMPGYFRAYDVSFDPPGGLNRKAWEKERTERIAGKSRITLTLSNVKIVVQGNQATVTFLQHYKADQLAVNGRKTLKMVRRGTEWRITQESVG